MHNRDDDDLPAVISHKQLRKLLKMQEDVEKAKLALQFCVTLARWCAGTGAFVVTAQTIYVSFIRGLLK